MRAPPESFRPTTGAPSFIARSMIFTIFAAFVSDSDPPNTVKSCANANTWRPSTRPWPATTPSPGTSCSAMPKSRQRCVTSLSTSSNVPGSKRSSIRSRAVSLPASCWRFCRSAPPPSSARRSRSASTSFGFTLRFHRLRLLPIFEELLEADVRERMVEQLIDDGRRACRDVGAEACRLDDVNRVTAARDEDLGREVVVRVDLDAVEDAERGDRFDVLDAAGVDEDFHGVPFLTFSPLILNHYRATSSTRSDHALELPALSTALIAYT